MWNEPTEVASKPPQFMFPLAICQHISPSLVPAGDHEWTFVVNFETVAIRFSCNSRYFFSLLRDFFLFYSAFVRIQCTRHGQTDSLKLKKTERTKSKIFSSGEIFSVCYFPDKPWMNGLTVFGISLEKWAF